MDQQAVLEALRAIRFDVDQLIRQLTPATHVEEGPLLPVAGDPVLSPMINDFESMATRMRLAPRGTIVSQLSALFSQVANTPGIKYQVEKPASVFASPNNTQLSVKDDYLQAFFTFRPDNLLIIVYPVGNDPFQNKWVADIPDLAKKAGNTLLLPAYQGVDTGNVAMCVNYQNLYASFGVLVVDSNELPGQSTTFHSAETGWQELVEALILLFSRGALQYGRSLYQQPRNLPNRGSF